LAASWKAAHADTLSAFLKAQTTVLQHDSTPLMKAAGRNFGARRRILRLPEPTPMTA